MDLRKTTRFRSLGLVAFGAMSLTWNAAQAQSTGELRSIRSTGVVVTTPSAPALEQSKEEANDSPQPARIAAPQTVVPATIQEHEIPIVTREFALRNMNRETKIAAASTTTVVQAANLEQADSSGGPEEAGPSWDGRSDATDASHPLANFWSADYADGESSEATTPPIRLTSGTDKISQLARERFIPDTTHEEPIPVIESPPPKAPSQLAVHRYTANPGGLQDPPAPREYEVGNNWASGDAAMESNDLLDIGPRRNTGFFVGTALLFAKPHFKEAFQVSNLSYISGQMDLLPFQYGYELSPRVWFGFQSESGMGIKASYWGFDEGGGARTLTADGTNLIGAHVVSTIFPANIFASNFGDQLAATDYLQTKIVNLLGTYETVVSGVVLNGGAGLRYAKLDQGYNATVTDIGNNLISNLNWSRRFEGMGPTVMVDARKRIGETRFAAFAQGGGSLLFGQKTLRRDVFNDQTPNVRTPPFLRLEDADEVVGIGELNLGLEWGGMFANGYCLSIRGLYEGQLWAESGAPTLGFLGFEGLGLQIELKR